jgi:hypothetical protein
MAKTRSGDANRAARYDAPRTVRARARNLAKRRAERLARCAAGEHEWINPGYRELICARCNAWREREPPLLDGPSWLDEPHAWAKDAPPPARWEAETE